MLRRRFNLVLVTVSLLSLLSFVIAGAAESRKPSVQEVIVVFKTHFDIGYTDLASNVVQRYRTKMIDDALKVVDQNRNLPPERQFAWTLPGWPLSKIVDDWPGQIESRQARIRQAFKDGRFVVHALPFTTHTETLELEDLVRGLTFASRLSREASLPLPRDAKMTDVPCHSWVLPTLLKHAGVDFLHLGCNAASSSPHVPRLFWWEGPDGSRVLTMYTAESYGTGLVPPVDWPYKAWLALIHTGDNHGPPTPEEVKKLLEEAAQKLPGVKVRIGRLSDFSDALLAEKAEIPVIRGDMPDTWIHGPMCDPQGAKLARNLRPELGAAETLGSLLKLWGFGSSDSRPTLAKAYEQSLLYGEHTWGGALYWVTKYGSGTKWGYGDTWRADRSAGRFQRLESSWAEHTGYIETARDLVEPLQRRQLYLLARAVNVPGPRAVVFNPLPWPRNGVIKLEGERASASVKPAGSRQPVPTAAEANGTVFLAEKIPATGYRSFELEKTPAKAKPALTSSESAGVLENAFFRVVLDRSFGCVESLVDKRSGRELVDRHAPHKFGQYLYERFASNQVAAYVKAYVKIDADWAINELGKPSLPPAGQVPYRAVSPADWSASFDCNDVFAAATMRSRAGSGLPHSVATRVVLYAGQPFVDLEITVTDKAADPWPEAGWICLPFKVDSPQFRIGRQGSIIDPAKDVVPGANRDLMMVNTGIAVFDPHGRGVGLCPLDSPLVSLGEPGCWKYSRDFSPDRPAVYINLFNNQWTTNFRLWNEGTWTSRVRIWSYKRYTAEAALIRPSLEARYPLEAAVCDAEPGNLPPIRPGIQLSRKGVLVTAFGPNPDGPGTVLRLWELAGKSGPCKVRLPENMNASSVQPVNLRGQSQGKPLPVPNATFTADLQGFAPASFVLAE